MIPSLKTWRYDRDLSYRLQLPPREGQANTTNTPVSSAACLQPVILLNLMDFPEGNSHDKEQSTAPADTAKNKYEKSLLSFAFLVSSPGVSCMSVCNWFIADNI